MIVQVKTPKPLKAPKNKDKVTQPIIHNTGSNASIPSFFTFSREHIRQSRGYEHYKYIKEDRKKYESSSCCCIC